MPESRLVGYDPLTGVETWFHPSDDGEKFTIEERNSAEWNQAVVDLNKAQMNDTAGQKFGDGKHVARLPMSVFIDLQRKGITKDEKAFRAWLNDPDNRFFRTFEGNV